LICVFNEEIDCFFVSDQNTTTTSTEIKDFKIDSDPKTQMLVVALSDAINNLSKVASL
jgi:hypothetical protein